MSAADDYARRGDIDRLDRAVDRLREQLVAVERRQADLRDADNRAHAAEHDAIEARIETEFKEHETEHEREKTAAAQASEAKGANRWSRTLAILTVALGVAGLYIEVLLAHKH